MRPELLVFIDGERTNLSSTYSTKHMMEALSTMVGLWVRWTLSLDVSISPTHDIRSETYSQFLVVSLLSATSYYTPDTTSRDRRIPRGLPLLWPFTASTPSHLLLTPWRPTAMARMAIMPLTARMGSMAHRPNIPKTYALFKAFEHSYANHSSAHGNATRRA